MVMEDGAIVQGELERKEMLSKKRVARVSEGSRGGVRSGFAVAQLNARCCVKLFASAA